MPASGPARDLLGELERGQIEPLYCLYGRERFLLGRALEALRAAVLEPQARDFNHDVLDARTSSASAILVAARTLPMMARRRLVTVRGIDEMRAEALEELLPYLAQPAPETVLVLVAGDKVDARLKFFAALKKRGALCAFDPPRDRELYGLVRAEARARGGSIEEPAARLLAEIVGPDLGALAQALEKLVLYVGSGGRISEDDVATCVAETRARSIFDLCRAVGHGEKARALRLLRRMLEDRESPLGLLAMLTRHFRQVALARELGERRASKADIASTLGINPYFVDGLLAQARRFSPPALARAFDQLYQADRALKSSKLDDGIILEQLVSALAPGG